MAEPRHGDGDGGRPAGGDLEKRSDERDGLRPATGPSEAGVEPAGAEPASEEARDPEVEARRAAALSMIRRFGDPVLRSRATAVDRFDDALRAQVARMGALLSDALGVGLAAPQVGLSQRLLVYRLGPEAPLIALVNPELEWRSEDRETLEEGCLSIPAVALDVERPVHVRVRAVDEAGDRRLVEASGLEARVIQHEIDHLDGVLILDRVSREERKEAMRALREAEREAA
jgi:peptide deformylase